MMLWFRGSVALAAAIRKANLAGEMSKRAPLTTGVIACRWRKSPGGWQLWVKGRENVGGSGATYEAAQEALIDAIMRAAPDLDAVLPIVPEFDPPLPATAFAEPYLAPELYLIRGDEIFELNRPSQAEVESAESRAAYPQTLFTEGICPSCGHGRGERTAVAMRVDNAPRRVDAGWIRAAGFRDFIRLFSGRFLELLTSQERERLTFRPITMPPGSRRQFYELRGRPNVERVGVRGLDADGLECPECGHRSFRVLDPRLMDQGLHLTRFVCAEDLPSPLVGCFTVGCGNDLNLCVGRERWDALREQPHARGIMSERIGVVPESGCERRPRIRNRREHCEVCSEWPEPRTVGDDRRAVFELPADACSRRNFAWVAGAERSGHIRISQATQRPVDILELALRRARPARTEFVSFRCPNCWRLGWIVLSAAEAKLKLLWRYGLG